MHKCEICGRKFKTSQALASHKLHKHREKEPTEPAEVWEMDNLIRKIEEIERRLDNVCVRLGSAFYREMIKSLCPICKKFTYLKYGKRFKQWVCENCGQPV